MDYISEQEYIEMKVFDIITIFYSKAKKIDANISMTTQSIHISKKGRSLYVNFQRTDQQINNTKVIGYLMINSGGKISKFFLTENFEWIINIPNRPPRKLTTNEIEYIFYKTFGEF